MPELRSRVSREMHRRGAAVSCATRRQRDSSSYEIMQNASWLSNSLMHFASRRVISWKWAAIIHWLPICIYNFTYKYIFIFNSILADKFREISFEIKLS